MSRLLPYLHCRSGHAGGIAMVAVAGEIDAGTAPAFREALLDCVAGESDGRLIVDMREAPVIDSEGLRVLLGARLFYPAGIALVGAGAIVRRVLAVTGSESLFILAETYEDAAAYLQAPEGGG